MLILTSLLTIHRGIEVWRIENSSPVAVPESSYGKFFTGETYMILKVPPQSENNIILISSRLFVFTKSCI